MVDASKDGTSCLLVDRSVVNETAYDPVRRYAYGKPERRAACDGREAGLPGHWLDAKSAMGTSSQLGRFDRAERPAFLFRYKSKRPHGGINGTALLSRLGLAEDNLSSIRRIRPAEPCRG
ncbi:hypothetical protein [Methylorubrum extorquens]